MTGNNEVDFYMPSDIGEAYCMASSALDRERYTNSVLRGQVLDLKAAIASSQASTREAAALCALLLALVIILAIGLVLK